MSNAVEKSTHVPVIEAHNLRVEFADEKGAPVVAVDDVSLAVRAGELVAVKGRSGSGKSTLLAVLGLLLTPQTGSVWMNGAETTSLEDGQRTMLRSTSIGFVFQNFALVPQLTAIENVMAAQLGAVPKASTEWAMTLLDGLGLRERANQRVTTLSGGEQQRVAIARSAVNKPNLILADEPTGSLDRNTEQHVMSSLKRFAEGGTAVVVVTHSEEVAHWASRTISVDNGRVVTELSSQR